MPDYDFDLAIQLKKEGKTNGEIATLFGYSNESGFRRMHKREIERRKKQAKQTPRAKRQRTIDDRREYHLNTDLNEIKRMKYGTLEPTSYRSNLSPSEWQKYYLGSSKYRWDLPYLEALDYMLNHSNQVLGLMPRHSGKTTKYLGNTTQELLEIQQPHLCVCSPKRPKILFRDVERNIIRNPLIRRDYGDIIETIDGRVQSNRTELVMYLHDSLDYDYIDPLFRVASRETDIIGSHPTHLHLEDPTQQESDAGIEKLKEWFGEVVRPMTSFEKENLGRMTGTATRKRPDDFADYLFSMGWTSLHYEAITVIDGTLPSHNDVVWETFETPSGDIQRRIKEIKHTGKYELLNPYWNIDKLLEACVLDYSSFMSQYQNSPISRKGSYFNNEWWVECPPFDTEGLTKYLVADTSFGETEHSDFTCIGVWVVRHGRMYLIDMEMVKGLDFDEICNTISLMSTRHKCQYNYVHATLREKWIVQRLRKLIGNVTPVIEKRSKIERINVLDNPFKLSLIWIFNTCSNLLEAKKQYLLYDRLPSTTIKKDDFLDMVATAFEKLRYKILRENVNFKYELF